MCSTLSAGDALVFKGDEELHGVDQVLAHGVQLPRAITRLTMIRNRVLDAWGNIIAGRIGVQVR